MRVNVYREELTSDIEIVEKRADTGRTYYGVRLYLASSHRLHHTENDDDRSAVTIWVGNQDRAEDISNSLYSILTDMGVPGD